jgi:hypothetical protein
MKVMVSFPFIPLIECELLPRVYFSQYEHKLNKIHLSPEFDTGSTPLPKNYFIASTKISLDNHTKLCLTYEE